MRKNSGKTLSIVLKVVAAAILVAALSCCLFACRQTTQSGISYLSVLSDFKTEYYVGEALDPTGTLKVTYQTDYFGVTPITEAMVSGFDSSREGDCTVTVSFGGKSTTVLLRILPLLATSLTLNEDTLPTVIYKGQGFPAGATLGAVMADGSIRENVPVTADMIGGFDPMKTGEQLVSVSYCGLSESFSVTVKEDRPLSLSLSGAKPSYEVGEALKTDGAKVVVTYESGKTASQPLTAQMVSSFSTAKGGVFAARVTLSDLTCDYPYSVGKKAVSAVLVSSSLPSEVEKGSAFPQGGQALVTYNDETQETVPLSGSTVKGFDTASSGSRTAEIEVQGVSVSYSYTVLKGVTQGTPLGFTSAVLQGSSFDGFGEIAFVFEDGSSENVPLSDERVSLSYDTSKTGEIEQTATFRGRKYLFTVTVYSEEERNAVEEIAVIGSFNPIVYGDALDLSGVLVTVRYKYLGSSNVELKEQMISFDGETALEGDFEERTVTVSLLGKSAESSVRVLSQAYAARVTSLFAYGLPRVVKVGDEASFPSATLTAIYGGGYSVRSAIPLSDGVVSGFDSSEPAELSLSIAYQGAETSCSIRVISEADAEKVTDAAVLGFAPILFVGDELKESDLAGATVRLTFGFGYSEREIPLALSMLSVPDLNRAGQTEIGFSAEGIEKTLTVTVRAAEEKNALTAISTDEMIESTVGIRPDFSKISLRLEFGYGARYALIPLSDKEVEISPFKTDETGIVRVSVSYKGLTTYTHISFAPAGGETVVDKIEVDASSETEFEKGSAIDGVWLLVTYSSGMTERVRVTADEAPDFQTAEAGSFSITLTFGGKTAVYSYTVLAE